MSEWQALGTHRYRIAAGIFWLETHGDFDREQTKYIVEAIAIMQRQEDACGALINVRGGVGVSAEARRIIAQRSREAELPLPVAVCGAGLGARAVLTLMINAVRLVRKYAVPMMFCKDEDEAVVWLKPRMKARGEELRLLRGSLPKS